MLKDLYERINRKHYVVFDLESNGLLDDVTLLHCAWVYCASSDSYELFRTAEGLFDRLEKAYREGCIVVGHNVIKFDIPCVKLLTKERFTVDPKELTLDTLVLSRLIYPEMLERDSRHKDFPNKLMGSHSLKAWGYRLGELKGTYGETHEEAWKEVNDEMLKYCKQDVKVTSLLLNKLISKNYQIGRAHV